MALPQIGRLIGGGAGQRGVATGSWLAGLVPNQDGEPIRGGAGQGKGPWEVGSAY